MSPSHTQSSVVIVCPVARSSPAVKTAGGLTSGAPR
jgi:hypothetical protein